MTNGDILQKVYKGQKLRVLKKNQERWLLGFDVANIASYESGNSAYHSVGQENKIYAYCETRNGQYEYVFANEEGLRQMASNTYKEEVENLYLWCLENVFTQESSEEESDPASYKDELFGSPEKEVDEEYTPEEEPDGLEMITKTFQDQDVRVTEMDGELHVAAADVADVLGYDHTPNFTAHVRDKYKGVRKLNTLGGPQKMTVISELGIYDGLSSAEGELAEKFQEWFHKHLREYRKGNVETSSSPDEKMIDSDAKQMVGLLREQLHQEERRQQEMADIRMLLEDIKQNTTDGDKTKPLPASTGDGARAPVEESPSESRQTFKDLVQKCADLWDCSKPLMYHQVYTQLFRRTGVDIYNLYFEGRYLSKLSVVVEKDLLPHAIEIAKAGLTTKRSG